jgi:hypothetical protein
MTTTLWILLNIVTQLIFVSANYNQQPPSWKSQNMDNNNQEQQEDWKEILK